jgi:hypothetical protein
MSMILLYTLLLFLLGLVKLLVGWRARALERKFMSVAAAVDKMLREADFKPGNSNKADPCAMAKRTVALGELVQKRDRVEANYFAWQRWADRLKNWMHAIHDWKGKKLPYTLGAVDVWMLLCLIDYLGVGEYFSTTAVIQAVFALYNE